MKRLITIWLLAGVGLAAGLGCTDYPALIDTTKEPDTSTSTDCVSLNRLVCHNDNIHWEDSCGGLEAVETECSDNQQCTTSLLTEPSCECRNSWSGDDCGICPTNWDPATDCSVCDPGWSGGSCAACVRYVDADRAGDPANGLSWESAFATVQDGIDAAAEASENEDSIERCSVWVKGGDYHVYQNEATDSIVLAAGVDLYGGFAGDETQLDDRDSTGTPSVLDGAHPTDPTLRVMNVVTVRVDTTIDGFVITGGLDDPNDLEWRKGAGMLIVDSSPTIRGCYFHSNAAMFGAALHAENARPRILDSLFVNNQAGLIGGGIFAEHCPSVEISGCTFRQNSTEFRGGAVALNDVEEATCTNSIFTGNTGPSGVVIENTDLEHLTITNALIHDNVAMPTAHISSLEGAGIIFGTSDTATLTTTIEVINSTIANNRQSTGGVGTARLLSGADFELIIENSIIWGNDNPDTCFPAGSTATIAASAIDCSATSGPGVISTDPQFVNGAAGDYNLETGSPCIDSASGQVAPEKDLAGAARVNDPGTPFVGSANDEGVFVDMGAYEYQPAP